MLLLLDKVGWWLDGPGAESAASRRGRDSAACSVDRQLVETVTTTAVVAMMICGRFLSLFVMVAATIEATARTAVTTPISFAVGQRAELRAVNRGSGLQGTVQILAMT